MEEILYTEREYKTWTDRFTINWSIDRRCNFKCVYCIKTDEHRVIVDNKDLVEKLSIYSPLRIIITGGEPLLVDGFVEICNDLGKIAILEIQTNLSVNSTQFIDNINSNIVEKLRVTYHPQERIGIWSKEKFVKDVLYAKSKGFNIEVFFVDYPAFAKEYYESECKYLVSNGIIPIRKRYCGDYIDKIYTGDAIIATKLECYAGYKSFFLWEDFTVTAGDTCRIVLGNLFTGYKLFDRKIKCPQSFCGCLGREFLVDKFWDDYYQKWYGKDIYL